MGRGTLIALAFAASAACSGGEFTPINRPDAGDPCTAGSHTCAGVSRCVNSYCVSACTGGAPCPAGTVCGGSAFPDDVCLPLAPITCATTLDCPVNQGCLAGHCVSIETVGDGGSDQCIANVVQDKCAPDAVCTLGLDVNGKCLGLPLCGADGGCPPGGIGQACNLLPDGGHVIQGKGPVCLIDQCDSLRDCSPSALCFHGGGLPWGRCQRGITGDPCASGADCISAALCDTSDAGVPDGGDAGPIGTCHCVISTADAGACAGH
jgi:hypothetical protein